MSQHITIFSYYKNLKAQVAECLPADYQSRFDSEVVYPRRPRRVEDAEIFLELGEQAIERRDPDLAILYLSKGIASLGQNGWQYHRDLTLSLYGEMAQAERLSCNFEESLEIAEAVLRQTVDQTARLQATELKVMTLAMLSRVDEAIAAIFQLFDTIGFDLANEPPPTFDPEQLATLPELQDPCKLALLHCLKLLGELGYTAQKPLLCQQVIFTEMRFCLEHGRSSLALQIFADYALVACCYLEDVELGYRLGQIAVNLLQSPDTDLSEPAVLEIVYGLINHWKCHVRDSIPHLERAFQKGVQVADFMMGGVSGLVALDDRRVAGDNLPALQSIYAQFIKDLTKLNLQYHLPYAWIGHQLVINLQDLGEDAGELKGDAFNETTELPELIRQRNCTPVFLAYVAKTMLNYLSGNFPAAIAAARQAREYQDAAIGLMTNTELNFYQSLALLARARVVEPAERLGYLGQVYRNQEALQQWARRAPMNFHHRYLLVKAERAWVLGNVETAAQFYQSAIAAAQEHDFPQDVALANHRAGEFYLSQSDDAASKQHLRAAYQGYSRWGAHTLARRILQRLNAGTSNSPFHQAFQRFISRNRTLRRAIQSFYVVPTHDGLELRLEVNAADRGIITHKSLLLMRFALLTGNFCRLVFCDSVLEFDTLLQIYPQVGERLEGRTDRNLRWGQLEQSTRRYRALLGAIASNADILIVSTQGICHEAQLQEGSPFPANMMGLSLDAILLPEKAFYLLTQIRDACDTNRARQLSCQLVDRSYIIDVCPVEGADEAVIMLRQSALDFGL